MRAPEDRHLKVVPPLAPGGGSPALRRVPTGETISSHDDMLRRRKRIAIVAGAVVLASAFAYGLFGPSGTPTYKAPPKGVEIAAPFATTDIIGAPVSTDVRDPEYVGFGEIKFGLDGLPLKDQFQLQVGALVIPKPDGSTEVDPLGGASETLSHAELAASSITVPLTGGAKLIVGLATDHANEVNVSFLPGADN